jgi:AraC-like DNA-binding protein
MTSEMSAEAIAAEVGFADGSHLHRMFVRHYGCTPGQYRTQGQSRSDPAEDP